MAKKKIYAVRKGHKTGLFATWAECQKAVSGYSGAEFRGFTEKEEALAFLNMETTGNVSGDKAKEAAGIVEVPENMVIAYQTWMELLSDGAVHEVSRKVLADMHSAV